MLTGLVSSAGLFRYILTETEADDAATRIGDVSRMDIITQGIVKDIAEARPTLAVTPENKVGAS
jgi:hypothetical protein